jgi:hypothetical protein
VDVPATDSGLHARALSNTRQLAAHLRADEKGLTREGAEWIRRAADASQRVADVLAKKRSTEHDSHD